MLNTVWSKGVESDIVVADGWTPDNRDEVTEVLVVIDMLPEEEELDDTVVIELVDIGAVSEVVLEARSLVRDEVDVQEVVVELALDVTVELRVVTPV